MFFTHTLANGLTIIGEYSPTAVSTSIGFFVRTGARDETPEVSGVSHFLEHMMFKGTASRSALDISYQLGALGAQANAFTSEENTVYYMAVLPEYLDSALELLSDMMRSALDSQEFDVEKKVILEEIALYQDRPSFMLFERAMREFFGTHQAGNSVLGSIQSITDLSRDQMKRYFDGRYSPSNMVFAISGAFEKEHIIAELERLCGHWQGTSQVRELLPHVAIPVEHTLKRAGLSRAHICLVAPGPSAQSEARYAASVLTCILGDGSGSKTYWELIDKGLADSASIDIEEMDGTGMLYAYASCSPENLDTVEATLRNILREAGTFDDEMFSRAMIKLASRLVLQGESTMRRLMSIGLDWIYRGEYQSLKDELEELKLVSRADIDQLLTQYDFQPTCALRLVPE
jgi:predicted Zn-dependent peptidase